MNWYKTALHKYAWTHEQTDEAIADYMKTKDGPDWPGSTKAKPWKGKSYHGHDAHGFFLELPDKAVCISPDGTKYIANVYMTCVEIPSQNNPYNNHESRAEIKAPDGASILEGWSSLYTSLGKKISFEPKDFLNPDKEALPYTTNTKAVLTTDVPGTTIVNIRKIGESIGETERIWVFWRRDLYQAEEAVRRAKFHDEEYFTQKIQEVTTQQESESMMQEFMGEETAVDF